MKDFNHYSTQEKRDKHVPDLLTRRAACAVRVTLNGEPARIGGAGLDFPYVVQLKTGLYCEYSWPAVMRKIESGNLDFKSH